MAAGTTYKQCSCRDSGGKRLGQKCPQLRRGNGAWSHRHGRWYYQLELPPRPDGTRRNPLRRGGFGTQDQAEKELATARELLAIAAEDDLEGRIKIADAIQRAVRTTRQLPDPAYVRKAARLGCDPGAPQVTVGEWLDQWLAGKKNLRTGTLRSYEPHIRLYYKPLIGHIRVNRLRVADAASVFEAIDELNDIIGKARTSGDPAVRAAVNGRRPVGPATKQRIRATLRSALGTYMKQHPGLLEVNAAALVDLPSGKRPRPLVWTEERVRAWQRDSQSRLAAARASGGRFSPLDVWVSTPRPSRVMVWTPAQTSVFLAYARRHRLYALYHLIAYRGLRRGEACGLRRADTDLAAAVTTVRWQITQLGWAVEQAPPKSEAGERQVALDAQTVAVLRAHRHQREQERTEAGMAWHDSGFEFTTETGELLHPAFVTAQFEQLAYLAGLPPIRLHDLRHFAATLALAAGVDIKIVQDMLGHSSRAITSDTYTTVLPEVARAAAEAAAALIPVLIGSAETETTDARRQAFAADTVRCSAAGAEGREVLGQPDQRVRDGGDLVVR
jgi:integrase